ncbi:LysR family transcriptional regulator [Rhizosaccharibacter radicis]|uniref:LysR family transcriptional regulator n=1 Tax=Rhizosaccharibacter radicis TaxID=2782605 RepID=A0ABT1VUN1_9PROT|nr:LysR family transcriptional regulator [Acetobacteraceae bacterium KSS12]
MEQAVDWDDLRVVLAIAREGSLRGAARVLGQSQPTMGRRLRSFETRLGRPLFQRTADGFLLTDDGSAVLLHAERVEQEVLALDRRLAGQDGQLDGTLRVTSSDWFATHVLAPVLCEFATLQPRVIVETITGNRVLSLSRREADLAFRTMPFDEPEVVSRRLARIEYAAYLSSGLPHPRAGDGTGTALITSDTAFAGRPEAVWIRRTLPNAHIVSRSSNRDVQAHLCAMGIGLAVLPRPVGDKLDGVERIDLGAEPPLRHAWIGYHRDLGRSKRLRALLDLSIGRLAR